MVVQFHVPVRAVTPGQTVAIYALSGLICLGGGPIWKHGPTYHDMNLNLPTILHPSGHNDTSVKVKNNK